MDLIDVDLHNKYEPAGGDVYKRHSDVDEWLDRIVALEIDGDMKPVLRYCVLHTIKQKREVVVTTFCEIAAELILTTGTWTVGGINPTVPKAIAEVDLILDGLAEYGFIRLVQITKYAFQIQMTDELFDEVEAKYARAYAVDRHSDDAAAYATYQRLKDELEVLQEKAASIVKRLIIIVQHLE